MRFKGVLAVILQLLLRVLVIAIIVSLGMYWNKLFEALLVLVSVFTV